MFTGLVSSGVLAHWHETPEGARIEVEVDFAGEVREGDSVAVNGVCLTAVEVEPDAFVAEVMNETLRRAAFPRASRPPVNVELAMRASDRLGGHIVQGHVDGVGTIVDMEEDGFARRVRIEPEEPALLRYVVEKGSIAVDGVSLTVAALDDGGFEVSLIPETLERTTFGTAAVGSAVNLEVDVLAKHVERLVAHVR